MKQKDISRFWKYVDTSGDCWVWTGGGIVNRSNQLDTYGRFWLDGRQHRAHRVSWVLHFGAIPDNLLVCHKCDNPRCIRPDHLFLGTVSDNALDSVRKRRNYVPPASLLRRGERYWTTARLQMKLPCGERHHSSKLTEAKVRSILDSKGKEPQSATAARYGISQPTVARIQSGRIWKHLHATRNRL